MCAICVHMCVRACKRARDCVLVCCVHVYFRVCLQTPGRACGRKIACLPFKRAGECASERGRMGTIACMPPFMLLPVRRAEEPCVRITPPTLPRRSRSAALLAAPHTSARHVNGAGRGVDRFGAGHAVPGRGGRARVCRWQNGLVTARSCTRAPLTSAPRTRLSPAWAGARLLRPMLCPSALPSSPTATAVCHRSALCILQSEALPLHNAPKRQSFSECFSLCINRQRGNDVLSLSDNQVGSCVPSAQSGRNLEA